MSDNSPNTNPTPSPESEGKKYEITVNDNRNKNDKNPFLNPVVLAAIVGATAGLLTTLLTIFSGDNQLSRLLTQTHGLTKYQVPVGTIMAYGGPMDSERRLSLDEQGWLVCDGSLIPGDEKYQALAKLLGHIWGAGNNSDRVSLPDLQGQFLRGIDPNGKNDPDFQSRTNSQGQKVGAVVGSYQPDELKSHNHLVKATGGAGTHYAMALRDDGDGANYDPIGNKLIQDFGGPETRPKNAYVYYIIKY